MSRRLQLILAAVTVALATLLPAQPASAGCAADDPTVEQVVCGVGYSTLQSVTCKVGRKLDPEAGCMT
ncbi:MAG TPA: hypothetical protein VJ927_03160 [Actinomycetota bacterium]|nr:hypothetical protein [Actinomycetota bacterium]